MGRIFLSILIFFFFIPNKSQSADINCGALDSATCWDTPGCELNAADECQACNGESFCPGGQTNKTLCGDSSGAGSDFQFAHQYTTPTTGGGSEAIRGARSKYECYREVSCTQSDGETTNTACREYYRDGTNNGTQYPTYDSSADIFYKGTSDQHWVSCDGNVGADDSPNETGDYHMENDNSVCYANTLPCSSFNSYFYTDSTNPLTGCDFDTGDVVQYSNGLWQPNNSCTSCTLSNIEAKTPNGTYICHASSATYNKDSTHPHTGDQSKNNVKLYFQYYPSTWQCNACKEGYVGFVSGFANQTSQKGCLPVAYGYYSNGCSSNSCYGGDSWSYVGEYQITDGIQCETYNTPGQSGIYNTIKTFCHPCYAGMTTDSTGATRRSDCHYTTETKFCDAYGCFQLTSTDSSNQNSIDYWNWYMDTNN